MYKLPLTTLLVVTLACTSPDDAKRQSADPVAPSDALPLLDVEWVLVEARGREVPTSTRPTLTFTSKPLEDRSLFAKPWRRLGGYDGCNWYGGGYRLGPGDAIVSNREIVATERGCLPGIDSVAWAFTGALYAMARFARPHVDTLLLLDSADAVIARLRRHVPLPVDTVALRQTTWRLDSLAGERWRGREGVTLRFGVVTDWPEGLTAAARTPAERTYELRRGCLLVRGAFALDDDRLALTSGFSDSETCPDPTDAPPPVPVRIGGHVEVSAERLVTYDEDGAASVWVRDEG